MYANLHRSSTTFEPIDVCSHSDLLLKQQVREGIPRNHIMLCQSHRSAAQRSLLRADRVNVTYRRAARHHSSFRRVRTGSVVGHPYTIGVVVVVRCPLSGQSRVTSDIFILRHSLPMPMMGGDGLERLNSSITADSGRCAHCSDHRLQSCAKDNNWMLLWSILNYERVKLYLQSRHITLGGPCQCFRVVTKHPITISPIKCTLLLSSLEQANEPWDLHQFVLV